MQKNYSLVLALGCAAALLCQMACAADSDAQLQTITVTGSRLPSDLKTYAGSVTLVSRDQILEQTAFTPDLGQVLASVVPGLAVASSGSYSNFDQTLRGRKPAIFIDGIPVSITLRDGGRDNRLIGVDAIGAVEAVSGATAIYGLGGAGGLINYVTRTPGQGPAQFQTSASLGGSVTHPSDSADWSVGQSALGRIDRLSYVLTGDYESHSSLFDAEGDRIPPDPQTQGGLADSHTYNVFGKVGYDLTDQQHLYLMGSDYDTLQRTDYSNGKGVFRVSKSEAVPIAPLGEPQFTKEDLGSARYVNDDVLGSTLDVDGYYSAYRSMFAFYPYPYYPPNGGQSAIDNFERGVRTTVNTPFYVRSRAGSALWGVDYSSIDARQEMNDGQLLVPNLRQKALAPFIQSSVPLASWLTLNAGVRYEHDSMSVDTFTTIPIYVKSLPGGNTVQGGTLDYSATLFNAGAVLAPFSSGPLAGASAYASYSEGFSVGDFGRALRSTTASSISQFDFKAQIVDSYEVGLRADYDHFKGHIAGYYNTAQYGSTFNAVTLELLRAPEHVWGMEMAWDARPSDTFSWGGSVSYVDGVTRNVTTGVWGPLDDTRIPPLKLVLYVEQQFLPQLSGRAQVTYSGYESRFPNDPAVYGESDIPSFALLDLAANYATRIGTWTLAVDNALDEHYFTPDSYIYAAGANFTEGEGTTLRLSYSVRY